MFTKVYNMFICIKLEKHLGKFQSALNNLQASNLQKLIDKRLIFSQEEYDKKFILIINKNKRKNFFYFCLFLLKNMI